MAETGITITVDDAEFQARLRNIWLQLQPGSQSAGLMRAIGYYMRRSTMQNFASESDPDGVAWHPLAASTLRRPHVKRSTRAAGHRKILQGRTSDLRNKMESRSDATEVAIGTNIFYSRFHQEGAPRAHIPVRRFLGFGEEDYRGIENLAWDYLVRVTG